MLELFLFLQKSRAAKLAYQRKGTKSHKANVLLIHSTRLRLTTIGLCCVLFPKYSKGSNTVELENLE